MSLLKSLTFTALPRAVPVSAEQHRRNKLVARLREQLELAKADVEGKAYVVKKRRWERTEDGQKVMIEVDKRLKRWWSAATDGSVILAVKWGSKSIEFEKGKAAVTVRNMASLVAVIEKLIAAAEAGEMDAMIASINKQRALPKKRAA
jgi:hypothetical protein